MGSSSAAFGRLCVETAYMPTNPTTTPQPPSGGCVLKQLRFHLLLVGFAQPPSGGCVLKPCLLPCVFRRRFPAAFGRLCVETRSRQPRPHGRHQPPSGGCVLKRGDGAGRGQSANQPPSGGCVLKPEKASAESAVVPLSAAFGRLCVETQAALGIHIRFASAAFGRLCVETPSMCSYLPSSIISRLRAAVC